MKTILCFLSLVWRPSTCPPPGKTAWQVRIDIRTAWAVARILNAEVSDGGPLTHDKPAAQSRRSLH